MSVYGLHCGRVVSIVTGPVFRHPGQRRPGMQLGLSPQRVCRPCLGGDGSLARSRNSWVTARTCVRIRPAAIS
jgi:hypothetical protein